MPKFKDLLPNVKGTYRFNADLSKTTWFQVGGTAEVLFKPYNEEDLVYFLRELPTEVPVMVLGVGSNILIRDGGVKGVVIKLGKEFNYVNAKDNIIEAGSACLDVNVAKFACENNIGGLEFLVGIPGTIGGAIRMNAGAYGTEIADVIENATALDRSGNKHVIAKHDFEFKYRSSNTSNYVIFTKATLVGNIANKDEIENKMRVISESRESTQPIRSRTGGSTFKNPSQYKAWELIDKVGMRGYVIGGAQFSEKHCNFLINNGNATAADIENLGELARKKVFEKFGINLEWEIKIIGEKP